ncbi:hypothetical protein MTP99_013339 [Tenebrio molitor]|nr:hypothetical protein MTP99_013339 [Tenebrio molitor]
MRIIAGLGDWLQKIPSRARNPTDSGPADPVDGRDVAGTQSGSGGMSRVNNTRSTISVIWNIALTGTVDRLVDRASGVISDSGIVPSILLTTTAVRWKHAQPDSDLLSRDKTNQWTPALRFRGARHNEPLSWTNEPR